MDEQAYQAFLKKCVIPDPPDKPAVTSRMIEVAPHFRKRRLSGQIKFKSDRFGFELKGPPTKQITDYVRRELLNLANGAFRNFRPFEDRALYYFIEFKFERLDCYKHSADILQIGTKYFFSMIASILNHCCRCFRVDSGHASWVAIVKVEYASSERLFEQIALFNEMWMRRRSVSCPPVTIEWIVNSELRREIYACYRCGVSEDDNKEVAKAIVDQAHAETVEIRALHLQKPRARYQTTVNGSRDLQDIPF